MTDTCTGILDWVSPQECRLRQFENGIIIKHDDPLVPLQLAESVALRDGMRVEATVVHKRPRRRSGKTRGSVRTVVETLLRIEGLSPEAWHSRKPFSELTPIDPSPRMALEYPDCPPANRLIDMFCPIGFGTRGLIVSPPKAGKTVLLQQIAKGIHHNYPDVKLVALLIDERPEEVTDFRRNVPAEVMASSNDEAVERHIELGVLAVDRAKRLLEAGQDVVLLLDSLTRLGRAFNNSPKYGNSGRTMSGGLDSKAMEVPKQLFGAARKAEEGGSLTILATCLVDTGSRADQVIFEEFKGTGNMELILDRSISEQRLYPAINLADSGTRREDLLLDEVEFKTVTALRRRLMNMKPAIQIEQLLKALSRFPTNDALVRG